MSSYGVAELPLHSGGIPPELIKYMRRLARAIVRIIVDEYGPNEIVRKLSDPLWFQAFSNVIGMDWDSSGSTTVVIYVLKSIAPPSRIDDMGFAVLGGKGADALRTPNEIRELSKYGLDSEYLEYVSRLSAKVDSIALQDGYTLYIHSLIVSKDRSWTVVQQGMNLDLLSARRYHIHNHITVFRDPHSGVACNYKSIVLNLVDVESSSTRRTILDIVANTSPSALAGKLRYVNRVLSSRDESLAKWLGISDEKVNEVRMLKKINPLMYRPIANIDAVKRIFEKLYSYKPATFEELLLTRGLGPEALRALALVADLIYGYRPSFKDPVTHPLDPYIYSYAHGGKDGSPFPVRIDIMKNTIEKLEEIIEESNLESKLKRQALRRLAYFMRRILNT